jgi:lysozyme
MNRDKVQKQLEIDEGVVYEVYLDHLGYPTFGIGHLILAQDPEHGQCIGHSVEPERVKEAFYRDLDIAVTECKMLYSNWTHWPDEVQEVLINMMFNLGRPRLSGFKKMNAALTAGDLETAAIEGRDSKWYVQVGDRAERLMTRLEVCSKHS